jgi:O-6-methylguanine DNA methyltransferase
MGNRESKKKSTQLLAHRPSPIAPRLASFAFRTKLGWMGLAVSEKGVSSIVLSKPSRRSAERALPPANGHADPGSARLLRDARRQIVAFLSGRRKTFDVPVDLSGGSSFQRRVWQTALRIPYGRARSYGWIASKIGGRRYARAVGHALGANPVPLVVPCHRVLAHDASLGGFSCGLAVKRRLLELEGTLALLKKGARR